MNKSFRQGQILKLIRGRQRRGMRALDGDCRTDDVAVGRDGAILRFAGRRVDDRHAVSVEHGAHRRGRVREGRRRGCD